MAIHTSPTTVVELLQKARSELARRGLEKGHVCRYRRGPKVETAPVCAVGAINTAAYGRPTRFRGTTRQQELRALAIDIANLKVPRGYNLPAFNDRMTTGIRDVLDVFDRAIDEAERQGV